MNKKYFSNLRAVPNRLRKGKVTTMFYWCLGVFLFLNLNAIAQCIPTGSSNNGDEIRNFSLSNLDHSTAASEGVSGYSDYTGTVDPAELIGGQGYVASLLSGTGSGSHGAAIWIDWNDNNEFEANEKVAWIGSSITPNLTVEFPEFQVPQAAGEHRLRVQYHYNKSGEDLLPCTTTSTYSETEDYLVNVTLPIACNGTPIIDSIVVIDEICPSVPFTIKSFSAIFSSQEYRWQSSPQGQNIWTDIPQSNSFQYVFTQGITESTDYRLILTCLTTNDSDTSSVATVEVLSNLDCYCTPPAPNYSDLYWIDGVVTTGGISNISNLATGFSAGGYIDYSATHGVETAPGSVFELEVNSRNGSSPGVKVWIDWNQNGIFETGELIYNTTQGATSSLNTYTINVEVPINAVPGITKMRIRNYTSLDPCIQQSYGETEDYEVQVNILPDCTEADAGIISSNESSICIDGSFTLSNSGATSPGNGLTYQWQSSPAGTNTWEDIPNANYLTYIGDGLVGDTDFRLVVSCTYGDLEDTSNVITVFQSPATDCYCVPPAPTYSTLYWIDEVVTTGGMSNITNLATGFTAGGYVDYSSTNSILTFPDGDFDLQVKSQNGSSAGIKVWIDWNQNGIFDTDELVYNTTSGSSSSLNTYNTNIVVPANAVIGTTKMRIRNYSSQQPCNQLSYGETEDYGVEVIVLTDCSDAVAGTISSNETEVCSSDSFILTSSGSTNPGNGLTYQWQSSPSGANTWTDIANATSLNYIGTGVSGDTDFRLKVSCSFGNLEDVSNIVTIAERPWMDCYCTPEGVNVNYYIDNFITTGGVENINNLNTGFSTDGYGDFTLDHKVAQYREQVIEFTGNYSTSTTYGTKIWVDWNQNGIFEASEIAYSSSAYTNNQSGNITVPAAALTGETRMRVGISSTPNSGPASPCGSGNFEFEDYMFEVLDDPLCDTLTTPLDWSLVSMFESICEEGDIILEISENIFGQDITYQFQSSLDGQTWMDEGAPTTDLMYVYEDLNTTMFFRALWLCHGIVVDSSSYLEVEFLMPEILSVTDASRCGEGVLNLSASVAAGSEAAWYDHPDAIGTPIFIGADFTTPSLDQTTSYWVRSVSGASGNGTLSTISSGGTSCSGGIMFNVTPNNNLQIDSLLARAAGSISSVTVYYRVGGFGGFETDQSEWILHEVVTTSATTNTMASIVLSNPIVMEASQEYGIYLNYNASYTNNSTLSATYSDANMTIQSGSGLCGLFSSPNSVRIFNGSVSYTLLGCESEQQEVIAEVVPYPAIELGEEIKACVGEVVTIEAEAGYDHYLWSTNETTSSITVTSSGVYSVEVTNQGCTVTDEVEVIFVNPPVAVLTDTIRLCEGEELVLNAGNEGADYTFMWSTGDTTRIITVDEPGLYEVIIDNGVCVTIDEVYVEEVLQANGESIHNVLIQERKFQFSVVNPVNVEEYFWDFGDGNTSTDPQPIHEYEDFDIYEVKVYLNQNFCDEEGLLMRHMIVEPVNIDEIIKSDHLVQLYPNPANEYVHIKVEESNQLLNVRIVDVHGRLLLEHLHLDSGEHIEINTSILSSGIYYILIDTRQGLVYRKLEIIK